MRDNRIRIPPAFQKYLVGRWKCPEPVGDISFNRPKCWLPLIRGHLIAMFWTAQFITDGTTHAVWFPKGINAVLYDRMSRCTLTAIVRWKKKSYLDDPICRYFQTSVESKNCQWRNEKAFPSVFISWTVWCLPACLHIFPLKTHFTKIYTQANSLMIYKLKYSSDVLIHRILAQRNIGENGRVTVMCWFLIWEFALSFLNTRSSDTFWHTGIYCFPFIQFSSFCCFGVFQT